MTKLSLALVGCASCALAAALGCSQPDHRDVTPGTEVAIQMPDGSIVLGRVTEPASESGAGLEPVADAALLPEPEPEPENELRNAESESASESEAPAIEPQVAETTVPAGTTLFLTLDTGLASDLNRVDDPVQARIDRAVTVGAVEAIPAGSLLHGAVTSARPSGKVKGRAQLSFRFDQVDIGDARYDLRSRTVWYRARSTKTEDATKIGIGTGAGALVGGLLGGGRGARTGAVVGGGAGTAMVLTTAGQEVEIRRGTPLEVQLEEPLVVRLEPAATD